MAIELCVFCRFWQPVYEGDIADPEEPGSCTGQIGKWTTLNGMWMKAADTCDRWQLSPARAKAEFDWIPKELSVNGQTRTGDKDD